MSLLKVRHTLEEKHYIGDIPIIRFYPKEFNHKIPTIIFYHGWSSNKENQRMRAYILSSFGYQVILPDCIHHGDRGSLDYYNIDTIKLYFWFCIKTNIYEIEKIIKYSINHFYADEKRLIVMGSSMGAITASGCLIKEDNLLGAGIINGSCNWIGTNEDFKNNFLTDSDKYELDKIFNELKLNKYNPIMNLDKLNKRKMIILHGYDDSVLNIEVQINFYKNIMETNYWRNIEFISYESVNHVITTNMIEDLLIWLEREM